MYKKLTQIHLNYKFKKITFKNFQIHGLSDCLAKGVKILDGMKCSPLLAPIPLDTWKFEMQLSSGIIITLFLLSHEDQPRSQVLSHTRREILVGFGHVSPRIWEITNKRLGGGTDKCEICLYKA